MVGAIPAGATTIEIGLGTGGSITTMATGTGASGALWAGSYDGYLFNVVTASDPVPINLASGTLDVTLPAWLGGATRADLCVRYRNRPHFAGAHRGFHEHPQRDELAVRMERDGDDISG